MFWPTQLELYLRINLLLLCPTLLVLHLTSNFPVLCLNSLVLYLRLTLLLLWSRISILIICPSISFLIICLSYSHHVLCSSLLYLVTPTCTFLQQESSSNSSHLQSMMINNKEKRMRVMLHNIQRFSPFSHTLTNKLIFLSTWHWLSDTKKKNKQYNPEILSGTSFVIINFYFNKRVKEMLIKNIVLIKVTSQFVTVWSFS